MERLPCCCSKQQGEKPYRQETSSCYQRKSYHCKAKYSRLLGQTEKKLPSLLKVRCLYQPGELEGGEKGPQI